MEDQIKILTKQIVEQLNLLDIDPDKVDPDDAIFGTGLGLDSIDALEIVVLLENEYGIKVEKADELRPHFESLRKLSAYVQEKRTK
jgi:acyl carrier protein